MHPATAFLNSALSRPAPRPVLGLAPACYIPENPALRAELDRRLLRRAAATLGELACIGIFLAAVLTWAALGAGVL